MLAILFAGTIWMNLASFLGLPVSITNAIVGSMVGFGVTILGFDAIHWVQVGYIVTSWISSPVIAGFVAYVLMISIQRLIFGRRDPIAKAKRIMPFYLFLIGLVLSFITIFKGISHFGVELPLVYDVIIILVAGLSLTIIGMRVIARIPIPETIRRRERSMIVEKQFAFLVALTTCIMVFAHGANDVSLAVGPLTVVFSVIKHGINFDSEHYPAWITLLGCVGVIGGLIFYGRKVIETVGSSITALTPSRAFAAILSAATTVVISTSTGIPVSATQTLVGAVLGVGLARGIGALNLIVIRNIIMSWIITLPASSILTICCYYFIRYLFRHF
jgi:PiT family inorganic phosphate transporter